ncbi:MAG: hypothetical protein PHP52_05110 [Bacteroidales bacterium]|nr:hypothetical protein [Bacteroidales bacterium]MDD4216349.1 hypothetical protein [Bacteroidales bacterium]MDY0140493.1 hypothetical protein [Bacteroidales bacterium]
MKKIILLFIGLVGLVISGFAMFSGDAGVIASVLNFDLGIEHISGAKTLLKSFLIQR